MKQLLVIGWLLVAALPVLHAQNLVANGSFEDENICTEYQKNCAPEAWIATSLWSNYYFDWARKDGSKAYHGTHFIGLTAGNLYTPGIRNFIRTRLLCGLQPGHQYQLEFFVRSDHPILDSIGIYFSPNDFLGEKRYFKMITPQLWTKDGIDKDRLPSEWQKVRLQYTADGTEGFITIGNFKRGEYSGIRKAELRNDYYFFIDSVAFIPADPREKLCAHADSVKAAIYTENERHNYLERRIYAMRRNPMAAPPLPKTEEPVVQKIDTLIIPDIFFATASYELTPASFHLLDSFANRLLKFRIDSVVMEGHTDSIGKLAYNEALSLNRANSVRDYIAAKVQGLQQKIITRGYAFLRPVASNRTPRGRQQNRRVEIFVYRRE